MTDGPTGWTHRSTWVRIANDERRGDGKGRPARDRERCRQCHLPWLLHPERYDPEDDAMIRSCSRFPVEPVRAIEECIAP